MKNLQGTKLIGDYQFGFKTGTRPVKLVKQKLVAKLRWLNHIFQIENHRQNSIKGNQRHCLIGNNNELGVETHCLLKRCRG